MSEHNQTSRVRLTPVEHYVIEQMPVKSFLE